MLALVLVVFAAVPHGEGHGELAPAAGGYHGERSLFLATVAEGTASPLPLPGRLFGNVT